MKKTSLCKGILLDNIKLFSLFRPSRLAKDGEPVLYLRDKVMTAEQITLGIRNASGTLMQVNNCYSF